MFRDELTAEAGVLLDRMFVEADRGSGGCELSFYAFEGVRLGE